MKTLDNHTWQSVLNLYRGQECFGQKNYPGQLYKEPGSDIYNIKEWSATLKPLTELSDVSIRRIGEYETIVRIASNTDMDFTRKYLSEYVPSGKITMNQHTVDYLRAIGFVTPYLNHSINDLVEQGVYKIK